MSGITRDDWLSALADVSEPEDAYDPNVITSGEAADLLGINSRTAQKRLRRLVKLGVAVPVRVRRRTAAGHVQGYSGYRLTKPLAEKPVKRQR